MQVDERFINRAAMGRAQFLIYPWFIFRFVGEQTQTSLGQSLNNATYDVYVGDQMHVALQFCPAWQTCPTPFDQLYVLLLLPMKMRCDRANATDN